MDVPYLMYVARKCPYVKIEHTYIQHAWRVVVLGVGSSGHRKNVYADPNSIQIFGGSQLGHWF